MHNWHIDAIAEHLEAVTRRDIKRLLITVPFRTMKSLLVSVFWPAWVWIGDPSHQWLCISHAEKLATRDNLKMRRLVESPWYRARWGDRFHLASDQNQKTRFENNKAGYRIAAGITAGITGDGGDTINIDDPLDRDSANSDLERVAANEAFDEKIVTRLNSPENGAIVITMQRLNEGDLAGHVKKLGDFEELMIPMRYEPERHCRTSIGWEDPRTEDGELMWEARFPEATLVALENRLGEFAAAGQLQQRPSARGGGVIHEAWWEVWKQPEYPIFDLVVASVDTGYEEKETSDYSACTVWGVYQERGRNRIMLVWSWKERLEFNPLVEKLGETARRFKCEKMLIENKASGKSVRQELRRRKLGPAGMSVVAVEPQGDKKARLTAASGLFESGFITAPGEVLPNGVPKFKRWAQAVIADCATFPAVEHDDLVDTVSQGINWLRRIGLELYPEDMPDHTFVPAGTGQPAAIY